MYMLYTVKTSREQQSDVLVSENDKMIVKKK